MLKPFKTVYDTRCRVSPRLSPHCPSANPSGDCNHLAYSQTTPLRSPASSQTGRSASRKHACTAERPRCVHTLYQRMRVYIGVSCLADASARKASIRSTILGGHLQTAVCAHDCRSSCGTPWHGISIRVGRERALQPEMACTSAGTRPRVYGKAAAWLPQMIWLQ